MIKRLIGLIGLLGLIGPIALRAQDSIVSVRVTEGVEMEMVWVEGGSFTMGSNATPKGVKLWLAPNTASRSTAISLAAMRLLRRCGKL